MSYRIVHKAPYFRVEATTHFHQCEYGCEWLCFGSSVGGLFEGQNPCPGIHLDCPDLRSIRQSDLDRRASY